MRNWHLLPILLSVDVAAVTTVTGLYDEPSIFCDNLIAPPTDVPAVPPASSQLTVCELAPLIDDKTVLCGCSLDANGVEDATSRLKEAVARVEGFGPVVEPKKELVRWSQDGKVVAFIINNRKGNIRVTPHALADYLNILRAECPLMSGTMGLMPGRKAASEEWEWDAVGYMSIHDFNRTNLEKAVWTPNWKKSCLVV